MESKKLSNVGEAWITASSDPVVEIDQTAVRFAATLHFAFLARTPGDAAVREKNRLRSEKLVKLRFNTLNCRVLSLHN